MRNIAKYHFLLQSECADGTTMQKVCHPTYDKLTIKHSKESGEMYYTRSLESEFHFIDDDFTFIHGFGLRTRFTLCIYESGTEVVRGTFRKADGVTDVDHGRFEVSITLEDEWKKLTEGMDDEYNLVELLKGSEEKIGVRLHPMVQLYEYNQTGDEVSQHVTHNLLRNTFTDYDTDADYNYEEELFSAGLAGKSDSLDAYRAMHRVPTVCSAEITGATAAGFDSTFVGKYSSVPVSGDGFKWQRATVIDEVYWDNNQWLAANFAPYMTDGGLSSVSCDVFYLDLDWIDPGTVAVSYAGLRKMRLVMLLPLLWDDTLEYTARYFVRLYRRSSVNDAWTLYSDKLCSSGLVTISSQRVNYNSERMLNEAAIHTAATMAAVSKEYDSDQGTYITDGFVIYNADGTTTRMKINGTFAFRSVFGRTVGSMDVARNKLSSIIASYQSLSGIYCVGEVPDGGDELTGSNYNVYYMLTSDMEGCCKVSTRVGTTENRWGIKYDGTRWYCPPDDTHEWQPVCSGAWRHTRSLWVRGDLLEGIATSGSTAMVRGVKSLVYAGRESSVDFYAVGDAVKALLAEVDDSIVFEKDEAHSQFLFAQQNPVSGNRQYGYYITPKSNALQIAYDYPAWKSQVTLGDVLDMLRRVFNCYYDLYKSGGEWHLRIEHVAFYMNGLTYTAGSAEVDEVDLGAWYDVRSRRQLSMNTSRWEYDSAGQASRYEFGWMDTQSEVFNGQAIVVPESYRIFTEDKTEKMDNDMVSADIDFMLSNPGECSSDGLAIVAKGPDGSVTDGIIDYNGRRYVRQNHTLAYAWLHPVFWRYNVYPSVVSINGAETRIATDKRLRLRKGEVEFPIPQGVTLTPYTRIRTGAGLGEVGELEVDMLNDSAKATLYYESEND